LLACDAMALRIVAVAILSVADGAFQQGASEERESLLTLLMARDPSLAFSGGFPVGQPRSKSPQMKLDELDSAGYYATGGASELPMKKPLGKKELKKFWTKLENKGKAGSNLKKIPDKAQWINMVNAVDVAKPGQISSGFQYGQEIAIINEKGKLYAIANKLPPTGQPATFGKLNGDGTITEPISGTKYSLSTGKVVEWCPSLIGGLQKLLVAPTNVPTFSVRKLGNAVQAQINVNLKRQYEQKYWRGILDAQGKVDGAYY